MNDNKRKNCKPNISFASHMVTVFLLLMLVAGFVIGMSDDGSQRILGISPEMGWVVFLVSLTLLVHRSVESCKKVAQECAKYRKSLQPSV
ncbi:MAG: hypothetical protein RLZZ428_718 [Pseudomonadota bacterium]|jgi:hypothetical protein